MAANSFNFDVNLKLNMETKMAKTQIEGLQQLLLNISNLRFDFKGINNLTNEINEASMAAMKLQSNLLAALNPLTGTLDFSKFNTSIEKSGESITNLASRLLMAGDEGLKTFMSLANAISKSDIPIARTSKLVNGLWSNLKKAAGWQVSSTIIHGLMGGVQLAIGYALALDKSLTDIRIVTGQSADLMARFAKEANTAAKKLSTTTTDYTNASLIYYQLGLSDAEVKKRSDITIKMANATGTSALKVSDLLTSIWNNFDNGTKSLEHYADVMTALGASTASSTDEIAKGILKFAAISDTVGLSYEYAASALATITATTRESADIVGNSLKTLFSRIQGLLLGETLDDGTTLNKYSTALAKVGISIKNSNGELKAMDTILNDMGAKWNTLAEDLKMALALAVGGVRQYAQVMTLMENWDFFKENLNTAKTATGTLLAQADIFADSWEAALNRMRASWEGLWDSLIDSDSFKLLLNIGSTLVEGLTTFVDSIGGATGVLSSSLGLVGTVFKSEIASTLTDAAFSVSLIFGGRNREIQKRELTINEMADTIEHGLFDNLGSTERATRVDVLRKQAEESVARNERRKFMTESERILDVNIELNLSATREALILNAKEIDDLKVRKESIAESTGDAMFFTRVMDIPENQEYYEQSKKFDNANKRIGEIDEELKIASSKGSTPDGQAYTASMIRLLKLELLRLIKERDSAKEVLLSYTGITGQVFTKDIANEQVRYKTEMDEIRKSLIAGVAEITDEKGNKEKIDYDNSRAAQDVFNNDKKLWDKLLKIDTNNTDAVKQLTEAQKQFLAQEKEAQAKLIEALDRVEDSQEAKDLGISDKAELQSEILREYNLQKDLRMVDFMLDQLQGKDAAMAQQYRDRIFAERLQLEKLGIRNQLTETELRLLANLQKTTKRMNIAEGITSGLTGVASMQGAKESLKAMQQAENTGEKILGAVGTGMNAMNAYSNFNLAFLAFGASSLMAGVLSASLMAFDFAASAASELLSKSYNALKIIALLSAESAALLLTAYATNQNNHAILLNNIESYNKATQLLNDLGMSSKERALSEYDLNQIASKLISDYNLKDDEFYRVGNRIEITQAGLDRITEESELNVSASKYAADEASVNAKLASVDYQELTVERSLLNERDGYDKEDVGGDIAAKGKGLKAGGLFAFAGGVILAALGAAATATGIGAAAGAPMMAAGAKLAMAGGIAAFGAGAAAEAVGSGMIADSKQELLNSFIDRALALTKETGSTAWMDEENVEGFNAELLLLLKNNRHRLEDLKDAQEAAKKLSELVEENIARNLVVDHEATRDFELADKIADGVVEAYRKGKEDAKLSEDITGFESKDAQSKYTIADELRKLLGLDGLNQLTWTKDDTTNKQLQYTYMDEKGVKQEGYINYDAIMDAKIAKEGLAAGNNYISAMTSLYDKMESTLGKTQASGILSLLTGGDFESATQAEIDAVLTLFDGIDFSTLNSVNLSEKLGITELLLQTYADTLGITVDDIINTFEIYTDRENYKPPALQAMEKFIQDSNYSDWFTGEGKLIFDSMTLSTMRTFYGKLNLISGTGGEKAGRAFLNNLSKVLNESGIAAEDYNKALESLMALDWTDWNIDTSVIEIFESLNGTINKTSTSFGQLIEVMKSTTLSIPNFKVAIEELAMLSGTISELKLGDSLSEADLLKFKDAGYDLSQYTMKLWDGSYTLMEDPEAIKRELQEELLDTFDKGQEYAAINKKYFDSEEGSYLHLNKSDINDLTFERLANSFSGRMVNGEVQYAAANTIGVYALDLGLSGNAIRLTYLDMKNAEAIVNKYYVEDGVVKGVYNTDGTVRKFKKDDGTWNTDEYGVAYSNTRVAGMQSDFDSNMLIYDSAKALGESIVASMRELGNTDWSELTTELRQQIASTYDTFDKFEASKDDGRGIIYDENGNLTAEGLQLLKNLALLYPELLEYVEAYNTALASTNEILISNAEQALKTNTAMAEAMATANKLDGVKISMAEMRHMMDQLREDMSSEDYVPDEEMLADLAAEVLAASDAYQQLSRSYRKWSSDLKEDGAESTVAAENIGNLLKTVLGLNDLTSVTTSELAAAVKEIDAADFGGIAAILSGDRTAILEASEIIAKKSNGGYLETFIENQTKKSTDSNSKLQKAIDDMQDFWVKLSIDGAISIKSLSGKSEEEFAEFDAELWEAADGDIEAYIAATEAAGYSSGVLSQNYTMFGTTTDGKTYSYTQKGYTYHDGYGGTYIGDQFGNDLGISNTYGANNPKNPNYTPPSTTTNDLGTTGARNEHMAIKNGGTPTTPASQTTGTPVAGTPTGDPTTNPAGTPVYSGGGYSGGGGGGGPVEVAVKSAQEFMTRYKTIDLKLLIADIQKQNALNKKDLLYGEARIAQLQKINGLLLKQQQLTSDRIAEEMDYLEKDRERIKEVLKRYNEDLGEDEESIELKFNSEGLITNYKLTIGAWAEEIASFYTDGELTSEESTKQEELKKKIDDLNVVIQDYEDSLNQLNESIRLYEESLYETFSNQAEELSYKVEYLIELEEDDMKYIDFYANALKDNMGSISDYIEIIGNKVNEFYDNITVYELGIIDLMTSIEDNPLLLWATEGIENMLTADLVDLLRQYRDGLTSSYLSAKLLRKEVEEKVLDVFEHWYNKIDKNISAISHFSNILSLFKDIINITGQEALGLSDSFMKSFEQLSIDLTKDSIEATKKQYKSLAEIYADAQMKLEQARASGDEDSIKHWEEVVNKVETEMNSAQDAILSALNQTLTLIAEQFTNAVEKAIEDFNNSIYAFNGLDGLIADYERINEQQDLMVADYEKIYTLNKLNRQLEKTLDDTKLIAGKQKLLEFQLKINDINKSNVELSKYELEYLQAEYDLRLAEIELENARNAKDTVKLSRDSEGNWSYIYTLNESAIDEAEQKYEDALFKMQQLSQDYTKEMSSNMMEITQAMRDEIAELSIQDFTTPEEYYQAIQEIENRYSEQLAHREAELNKSIANSADLYKQDWLNYSNATGYKLSYAQDWTDRFSETTLGTLMGSGSYMSDYSALVTESTNQLTGDLVNAATTYFTNANSALETYGTSLQGFAGTVNSTTSLITDSSKQATVDITNMATDMVDAFSKVANEVRNWQIDFGDEISDLLDEIGNKIQEVNDIIAKSNELGKLNYSPIDLIGQQEASELLNAESFNNKALFGSWSFDEDSEVTRHSYTDPSGEVKEDVELNLVEFNGLLIELINKAYRNWATARTDSPEREAYGDELKKLVLDYWKFKRIIDRIYDLTDISMPEPDLDEEDVEGLASGGYTGEWGSEGKLALLHEKELVLNADDTANFLLALLISRLLVEMIEMNARQSSLGLGEMHASTIQDTTLTIEQQVSITAEFPNAVDHSEIEEAFDNLINMASQYAYRN